ncbi:MAG TPA: hypothetical protein VF633_01250 [Brevundimonas sp.]|jgi:phage host-nuclease inhibitor protein Gam
MPRQALQPGSPGVHTQRDTSELPSDLEYPVREYIGGMTRELARMAREDGDEVLAVQLERASERAALSIQIRPVARIA